MHVRRVLPLVVAALALAISPASAQRGGGAQPPQTPSTPLAPPSEKTEALKKEVAADVESRRVFTQQLVDQLFSYSELGFQETETQRHLTDVLVREGFDVQRSVAGVPTSWVARYGSGHPIIALGTDIDGLPSTNQTPGVVTRKELVPGAPGHGEGHNAGQALIMTAALAVKKVMDRDKLPGTLMLWPGVAEEALGTKAQFVRAGRVQGCRRGAVRPRRVRPRHELGRGRRQRHGVGRVLVQGLQLARRGGAVARARARWTPSS